MSAAAQSQIKTRKRRRGGRPEILQKPRGVIHPRVQKVGAEHFGIVAVDCAKARSKWMLADFWGNVLLAPAEKRKGDMKKKRGHPTFPDFACCYVSHVPVPHAARAAVGGVVYQVYQPRAPGTQPGRQCHKVGRRAPR